MSNRFNSLLDFDRQRGSVSKFREELVVQDIESCREEFFTSGSTADCLSNLANYAAITRRRLRNKEKPCPKTRTIQIVELSVSRWMMEDPPESLASPQEILEWLKRRRGFVQHARNWASGNARYRMDQRSGITRRSIAVHLQGVADAALRKVDHLIEQMEKTISDSVEEADQQPVRSSRPAKVDERGQGRLF